MTGAIYSQWISMTQLKRNISPDLLAKFCSSISSSLGLHFGNESPENMEYRLQPVAEVFGFEEIDKCLTWLLNKPLSEDQITTLAKLLTIGETYFFRDSNCFQALKEHILPEMIRKKMGQDQHLKIWCAACCTGEEPYSIAMLIHELLPQRDNWKISILGTDINVDFLKKAEIGIYNKWSFRAISEEYLKKYFTLENKNVYRIHSDIRQMVEFMYLNLVQDKYPSLLTNTNAVDLILCNNVLIYFQKSQNKKIITKLKDSLVLGGWLLVSAIEVPFVVDDRLIPHQLSDTIFFQKEEARKEETVYIPPPLPPIVPVKITPQVLPEAKKPSVEKEEIEIDPLHNMMEKGDYLEVIKKLEKHLLKGKKSQETHKNWIHKIILLVQAYSNLGNLDRAKYWCEKALLEEKLDPELYFIYSSILQEMELLEESIIAIKRTLFLNSDSIISYYVLGNLLARKGFRSEADRNYRNALQLLKNKEPDSALEMGEGITARQLIKILETLKNESFA